MIDSYANLVTEVAAWLHRADSTLTDRVPTFIELCEARLNRQLRLKAMEKTASLTASTSARTVALPTRFLEPIELRMTLNDTETVLTPFTIGSFERVIDNVTGIPEWYCISNGSIEFNTTPDQEYALTLRYVQALDLETDSTNDVLSLAPDVYLYGALCHAAPFLRDQTFAAGWEALYGAALQELKDLNQRTRRKGVSPVDPMLSASPGFDINRGY